jgi:hypothetical protein
MAEKIITKRGVGDSRRIISNATRHRCGNQSYDGTELTCGFYDFRPKKPKDDGVGKSVINLAL